MPVQSRPTVDRVYEDPQFQKVQKCIKCNKDYGDFDVYMGTASGQQILRGRIVQRVSWRFFEYLALVSLKSLCSVLTTVHATIFTLLRITPTYSTMQ